VNRCGAHARAPRSSVFARLASGAFYKTLLQLTLYEIIRILFRWEFLGFPWDGKKNFGFPEKNSIYLYHFLP
jgi:hypothetical protein